MLSSQVRRPVAAWMARRTYAAAATSGKLALDQLLDVVPNISIKSPPMGAQPVTTVSTLSNGVKVATYESFGPSSTVAIVVNAGPRYEDSKTLGAAQFLKHFGLKSTYNRSHVRLTREVELLGGDITTSTTREHVIYSADFLRGDLANSVSIVADIAFANQFKEYEVRDLAESIEAESTTALANPHVAVFEALHRAAFRGALSNPLYASQSTTHHMSPAALKTFVAKTLSPSQVTIVGAGVNHDDLLHFATSALGHLKTNDTTSMQPAKYVGGDLRLENVADPVNRYALAFEGASFSSPDFVPLVVLGKLLGGAKHVKWGNGVSPLASAAANIGSSTSITTFNIGYSDVGLFGIYIEAGADKLTDAVHAGLAELTKVAKSVSAEDLVRARAQAQFALLSSYETRAGAIEDITRKAGGNYSSPSEITAAIQKVSSEDITRVVQKLLKSHPTTVAYGDVINAPAASTLKL